MLVLLLLVDAAMQRSVPRSLTVHEPLVVAGVHFQVFELCGKICSLFMSLQLFINLPNVTIAHRILVLHLVSINAPKIDLNRQACWLSGANFTRGFQGFVIAIGQGRFVIYL